MEYGSPGWSSANTKAARFSCFKLFAQTTRWVFLLAFEKTAPLRLIKITMIVITTSNSMSVKAQLGLALFCVISPLAADGIIISRLETELALEMK